MSGGVANKEVLPLSYYISLQEYKIEVHGLKLQCLIGIHPHEKKTPQSLIFDIEAIAHIPETLKNDRYGDIVCYDFLVDIVKDICNKKHYYLIETLGWNIAQTCLEHPAIHTLRLHIKKPAAIQEADAGAVSLTLKKSS